MFPAASWPPLVTGERTSEVKVGQHTAMEVLGWRDREGGLGLTSDDGDEVLADEHDDRSVEEERPSSCSVDHEDSRDRADDVDYVRDDRDDERVCDTRALEERRAVVEDKVDTGWRGEEGRRSVACQMQIENSNELD